MSKMVKSIKDINEGSTERKDGRTERKDGRPDGRTKEGRKTEWNKGRKRDRKGRKEGRKVGTI